MAKGIMGIFKRLFGRKGGGAAAQEPAQLPPVVLPEPGAQTQVPHPAPRVDSAVGRTLLSDSADQSRAGVPDLPEHGDQGKVGKRPRRLLGGLKDLGVRTYAAALLVAVLLPGIWAVGYLFQTVFKPAAIPKRLLDWQARIDVGALRAKDVPGVTGASSRAPLAHYHRVERWFQQDEANGCTVSGCHQPLPHTAKVKIPAFTNFHTTFLACQMCHVEPQQAGAIGWVSTSNAAPQASPAMLQLVSYLDSSQQERADNPTAAHAMILRLLRDAIAAAGTDEPLSELLIQFDTSQPGSPVWRHDSIHASLTKAPAQCTSCHSDGPQKLDFQKLGYAQARAATLEHLELANQMQRIRNGERFEIPDLLKSNK